MPKKKTHEVEFTATKMVPKKVKVEFRAKNKKKWKLPLEKWVGGSRFSFLIYSFQSVFVRDDFMTVCT